jgi:cyclopropane-fatty-acyl-phospholipid synthase
MWVAKLERNRERAIAVAAEETYRAWRLYMAGSAQSFAQVGWLSTRFYSLDPTTQAT